MTVKQYGAISELRRIYNSEIPRDNVVLGIRMREIYKSRVLQATNSDNKLADVIKDDKKSDKIKAGIDALYNLLEEKKKSESTQAN